MTKLTKFKSSNSTNCMHKFSSINPPKSSPDYGLQKIEKVNQHHTWYIELIYSTWNMIPTNTCFLYFSQWETTMFWCGYRCQILPSSKKWIQTTQFGDSAWNLQQSFQIILCKCNQTWKKSENWNFLQWKTHRGRNLHCSRDGHDALCGHQWIRALGIWTTTFKHWYESILLDPPDVTNQFYWWNPLHF